MLYSWGVLGSTVTKILHFTYLRDLKWYIGCKEGGALILGWNTDPYVDNPVIFVVVVKEIYYFTFFLLCFSLVLSSCQGELIKFYSLLVLEISKLFQSTLVNSSRFFFFYLGLCNNITSDIFTKKKYRKFRKPTNFCKLFLLDI